jgi:two-component system, response regulator YesN
MEKKYGKADEAGMYKLMVVEDEDLIREGIVRSIDWEFYGYRISASAANGREAVEKIREEVPDVILTDVRMPLMDGLELARWVNENYTNVKILILSGFADFEYAKSAIRFKVFEYLLKPTNKEMFIGTFMALKRELDRESEEQKLNQANRKKLKEGLVKLREEFLQKLLDGQVFSLAALEDKLNYLEIEFSGSVYATAVLRIHAAQKDYPSEWQTDTGLLSYTMTSIVNEVLDEGTYGVGFVKNLQEVVILLSFDKEPDENSVRKILRKCISHIQHLILKDRRIGINAGVGLFYPDIQQIEKSYRQALSSLEQAFFKQGKNFFFYSHIRQSDQLSREKQWIKDYPAETEEILREVMNGSRSRTEELIGTLFDEFRVKQVSCASIRNYVYILCFLLAANISEMEDDEQDYAPVQPPLQEDREQRMRRIESFATIDELQEYVSRLFTQAAERVRMRKTDVPLHKLKAVEKVKTYIEGHYTNELSLEEIGKYAGLSPSYVSYLFKSVTGENYTEYVKKIRMRKAKDLLKQLDLKVYEVADMVGYHEYKYFALQFKKMFGISPSEYRERY